MAGVRVGHWTDARARTGCTVVLFPEGTVASGEVRGGAPATREWELLHPTRLVQRLDAVVLTGGSAFGLAACDGVVRWCEERGMGFPTGAGPVPIVVGAGLFDLLTGDGSVRPSAENGYAACVAATTGAVALGAVGAGTGATIAKVRGRDAARPGGVGSASAAHGDVVVGALVAVNAFGDVSGDAPDVPDVADVAAAFGNTTIGVVATSACVDKVACRLLAQAAQDAMAREIVPAHATVDGDAVVAASVGPVDAPRIDVLRMLVVRAMSDAIRAAVSA